MNLTIHSRNLEISESVQKLIERQARKLKKILPTFASDILDLSVNVERLPRGSQHQITLTLTLPQTVMHVEEIAHSAASGLLRAFSELLRRTKKFKSRLNRERLWRKQQSQLAEEAPKEKTRELEDAINDNLDKIENFIRRELYHRVILGQMPPGILEPHALVDDVFLEATDRVQSRPTNVSLDHWMFQIARRRIQERLQDLEDRKDEPHVEESAQLSSKWEDEQLNFYQPDESLRLEDLMQDEKISNPEEVMEREDLEDQLQKSVALLPSALRESFVLFALEGFTSDEVAMITGKKPREVLEEVEEARQQLRQDIKL